MKHLIAASLLGLSTALITPSVALGATTPTEEGRQKLAGGDARAAMIRFEQAIRNDPANLEARLGLSQALVRLAEFERAEKMARVVLRRGPSDAASLVLAEALFGQEKTGEAMRALDGAAVSPDSEALRGVIMGEQAISQANPVAALKAVGPAANHPHYGMMARLIGARAQYIRGDLVRAQRLVEQIIAEGGDTVPARLLRARLVLRAGDPGGARALAGDVLRVDPGNVTAGALAIEAALRSKDIADARAILVTLEPKQPDDPRPAYLEALILVQEGRTREAGDVAATIEPWLIQAPGGATLLAEIKISMNRLGQAERILRDRVATMPTDRAARQLLINVYDQSSRADQAEAVLNEGLRVTPSDRILLRIKAQRLMAAGDFDAAQSMLTLADGGQPGALNVLDALAPTEDTIDPNALPHAEQLFAAAASLQGADSQKALDAAMAAVAGNPDNPVALNLLAAAQARQGDSSAAKATLDRLLAKYPNFMAAIANRARLEGQPGAFKQFLEKAVGHGATSPQVLGQLAQEQYVTGQADQAVKTARAAHQTLVAKGQFDLTLPRLLMLAGDSSGAASALMAMNNNALEDHEAIGLGTLLVEAGVAKQAASVLAPRASSGSDWAMLSAATAALSAAGDHEAATGLLSVAHAAQPDQTMIALGWLEEVAKTDLARAQRLLANTASLAPYRGALTEAILLGAAGQDAAAFEAAGRAPSSGQRFARQAGWATSAAQKEKVLRGLSAWVDQHPGDVGALILLSGVAIDAMDMARAEKALAGALAVVPNDPTVLNNLALARAQTNTAESLRLAGRAYRIAPNRVEIAETYAQMQVNSGQMTRAAQVVRRARLVHPGNESLRNLAQRVERFATK